MVPAPPARFTGRAAFTREWAPVPPDSCVLCGFGPLDLEPRCPRCDTQRMPPNVVLASRPTEQDTVAARVESLLLGRSAASAANLLAFGENVRGSFAVVESSDVKRPFGPYSDT